MGGLEHCVIQWFFDVLKISCYIPLVLSGYPVEPLVKIEPSLKAYSSASVSNCEDRFTTHFLWSIPWCCSGMVLFWYVLPPQFVELFNQSPVGGWEGCPCIQFFVMYLQSLKSNCVVKSFFIPSTSLSRDFLQWYVVQILPARNCYPAFSAILCPSLA